MAMKNQKNNMRKEDSLLNQFFDMFLEALFSYASFKVKTGLKIAEKFSKK
jgi:hypothetical protein